MADKDEPRGANPALLKQDIDAGLTGDKVAFPDPAAAPLGTDDEAAGTPITPAQLEAAQRSEVRHGIEAGRRDADFGAAPRRSSRGMIIVLAGVAAIALLLAALL